jgi:hypothetical protein
MDIGCEPKINKLGAPRVRSIEFTNYTRLMVNRLLKSQRSEFQFQIVNIKRNYNDHE